MDAAYYITTLDDTAPRAHRPKTAAYAIIDLAVSHDFMKHLYDTMNREPVEWWSLFEGTEWQADWSCGPILVDLRNSDTFTDHIATAMESQPLGALIQTTLDAPEVRQRCQQWLFGPEESQERLLRFYEPRMLGPLLCVMGDVQRRQLIPPTEQWSWHDGQAWRTRASTESTESTPAPAAEDLLVVSGEQLQQVAPYRMAAQAEVFADYYQSSLTAHKDPVVWVLARLLEAHEASIVQVSDQERWVRLAIRHGDAFPADARFREVLKQEQWSASERLTAMESLRKPEHVTSV